MSNLSFITALGGSLAEGHGTDGYGGGGEQIVRNLTDIGVRVYSKAAADSMAADATANLQVGFANPFNFSLRLVSAFVVPVGGTLTAHADNHAVITLKTDDAAAGTPAAAATWTTSVAGTGTWAVGVRKAAVLTLANCTLVAGGVLWFNIAKVGSGVVVPTCDFYARWTRLG